MFEPGTVLREDQCGLAWSHNPEGVTSFRPSDNLVVPMTPLIHQDTISADLAALLPLNYNNVDQKLVSRIPVVIPSCSTLAPITTPTPLIENIVATYSLGVSVNLKHVAQQARNAEYNPKRFAAVIMRIREPRTTALIFNSGKVVVTGAKSEEACRLSARKFARIIQKLGFDARFRDFKIQNLVAAVDVQFAIYLDGLHVTHSQFSTYEPEIFPGLIYRMVKPRVVLLIFVSGKVVVTGARKREEIEEAFSQIYPILKGFKK